MEILEVLFDQYLNKNPITKESNVKNSSTTRGKVQTHSEPVSKHKTSSSDSQSIITKCFMDSRNTSNLRESMEVQDSENSSGNSTGNNSHLINSEGDLLDNIAASAKKINLHRKNIKRSRYIPIHTRRRVFERAKHCCEFTGPNDERCQSRSQLELDHYVKPYSQGGDHSLDNLKLHCFQHNLYRASYVGIGLETIIANV